MASTGHKLKQSAPRKSVSGGEMKLPSFSRGSMPGANSLKKSSVLPSKVGSRWQTGQP